MIHPTVMNAFEHREAIGRRFASRVVEGDAVFLSGAGGIHEAPYTVTDGEMRPLSGMNRLMLLQVMKDRAWRDSRFFTLDQIEQAGWSLTPGAKPIRLQFLVATGADGMPMESPSVKQFFVFNASDISGVPEVVKENPASVGNLALAVGRAGFSGDAFLGGDALRGAVCAWLSSLHGDAPASHGGAQLRVQLAATLLEVLVGLAGPTGGSSVDAGIISQWALGIESDPFSLFDALKDAEKLAAHVLMQVRAVETEVQVSEDLARSRVVLDGGKGGPSSGSGSGARSSRSAEASERVERLFLERAAVLAVPFSEKDKARALGALWYVPESLWFVPKGLDVTPFKEWDVGVQCLNAAASDSVKIDDFQKAMGVLGLDVSKSPKPDGKWHNVPVTAYKGGKNKSGSYIFSLDGGSDGGAVGTILNKQSGERSYWRFEGPALTPEQRARQRAEALAREAVAAAEAARVQDVAAVHASEIWSVGLPADTHGYVVRKGISAVGLRQVSGAVLLQYDEFKSESGFSIIRASDNYLIVPMANVQGQLRAVQAISPDGAVKTFMRGAQKKGAMCVLGAHSFDSLASLGEGSEVAYVEGVATGASFREASGGAVVVCFDAGNLETVAAQTFASLPLGVSCVLAVDNDQFHVERALGFLSDKLGVNPHVAGGMLLDVARGLNTVRAVGLGDVVADGQWQQTAKGSYRVTLERDGNDGPVRSMAVEIVPENGERNMRSVFVNRGVEAGLTAMKAIGSDRVVMVTPEFKSLSGRPTDWNDLAKIEGVTAIRDVLRRAGGGVALDGVGTGRGTDVSRSGGVESVRSSRGGVSR